MHINVFPSVIDASHLMSKHIPSNYHNVCQTMFGFSIYTQLFSDYSESVPFSKKLKLGLFGVCFRSSKQLNKANRQTFDRKAGYFWYETVSKHRYHFVAL